MINLVYENLQDKIEFTDKHLELIKKCIESALLYEEIEYDAELSLTIVDNELIKKINCETREIDRPTDVLSFPMLETDEDGTLLIYDDDFSGDFLVLGDIVISFEKAKEQAEQYGHSFLREIGFLTVHSVLHLLGYDHEKGKDEEEEMFRKQEEILNMIDLTR